MIIDIYMDYVVVNGQRLDRPSRISRSEWEDFWTDAKEKTPFE